MARFFSVLSGSVPSALTSDFFDSRSISDGINKRNGLIASRSIVSADVYEDLDAVNIDGSLGTYFPPDLLTAPNNPFTGTAYTSSIPGIVIPNDYRTRPTASILSTTAGVGETNPLDTVSVSFTSYLAASTAVKTVLDSITDGGPYGRIGLNASRTLHGLHHDQELGYFAWDDFTPGTASLLAANITLSPSLVDAFWPSSSLTYVTSSTTASATVSWGSQFSSDIIGLTSASLRLSGEWGFLESDSVVNGTDTFIIPQLTLNYVNPNGGVYAVHATASVQFFDVTIPTHSGSITTAAFTNVGAFHRLSTLSGSMYISNTDDGTCYLLPLVIYAGGSLNFDDNPGDGIGESGIKAEYIFRFADGARFTPDNVELPGYSGGANYFLVRANGVTPTASDEICEFTDEGVKVGACVAATVCA